MNTITKLLGATAALLITSSAFAQSAGNEVRANSRGNLQYTQGTLQTVELDVAGNITQENIGNISNSPANFAFANSNIHLDSPHQPRGNEPVTISVTNMNNNSVVLEADVMINVKATSFTAIFAATETGLSLKSTDSAMNVRLSSFIEGILKEGVSRKDVHVDFISMIPVYDLKVVNKKFSNNANEVQSGFQMKKNIHVNFTDHRALDKIITYASQAGIYDVVKVDYNIDNTQFAYDTLRIEAAKVIQNKRKIYEEMGLETKVMSLSYGSGVSYPIERYDGYTAYHQGNSYEQALKDNPNLVVREKEKLETIFYNKIPYNQFDLVMNADAGEPMVQFYYKLKVRYSVQIKPEKVEEEMIGLLNGATP